MCTQAHTPLLLTESEGVKSPCSRPPLPPPDRQSPQHCASQGNLSSSLQLSLVYSEPSISATLHSANYASLSAEAPPKLPFCYNQTLSQSERVPATPTCHRHSKPQDNLLGSQTIRRFIPKWDIHHVIENKMKYFYRLIWFHYIVTKNGTFLHFIKVLLRFKFHLT